jgi:hypothetical protein
MTRHQWEGVHMFLRGGHREVGSLLFLLALPCLLFLALPHRTMRHHATAHPALPCLIAWWHTLCIPPLYRGISKSMSLRAWWYTLCIPPLYSNSARSDWFMHKELGGMWWPPSLGGGWWRCRGMNACVDRIMSLEVMQCFAVQCIVSFLSRRKDWGEWLYLCNALWMCEMNLK